MDSVITVFFADDNEKILTSAKERLAARGVDAQCYPSGGALLAALAQVDPALPTAAVVDYVMPDGGESLVQELRERFPSLPLIVQSGLDMEGSIKSYAKGAYATMQKPLDYNELHDTLKELAGQEGVFKKLATDALNITEFDTCLVWQYDKRKKQYRIAGWAGDIDRDFVRDSQMSKEQFPRVGVLENGELLFVEDVEQFDLYINKTEALSRQWKSLIAMPLIRAGRLIGWLDCYKKTIHSFKNEQQKSKQLNYLKRFAAQSAEALHSTILTQQLRIIHETNQSLAGTLDNKVIYGTILSKIQEITGADCGWIYEYDNGDKVLKLGKSFGFDEALADPVRTLEQGGITGKVARTNVSLYVPDISQNSEGYNPETYIASPPGLPVRSELAIPLRQKERTLGVLTIKSVLVDFFTQEDSQLVTSLAAIAAISLERAKLTRHLSEVSRLAQEGNNFDALAEYVVNAVRDLTDADVNLWMMSKEENEGDDWLRIKCSSRSKKDKAYKKYIKTAKTPATSGDSLIAKALSDRNHIIIDDLATYHHNPPFYNREAISLFDWHSFMAVPLIGKKGEQLGAITLFSNTINKFNKDDGALIQHFANQAALALQEQRHIAILEELTEVGQSLTTGLPGARALSKKVVAMARKIVQADFAMLYPYNMENKDYYDSESRVQAGEMKTPIKELTEKPRKNGLAAFVRRHKAVVVEDMGDGEFTIKVGLLNQEILQLTDERYSEVSRYIKESNLIKRENVQSFIGVSLQATEQIAVGKTSKAHEVAVLYMNFRAPRHFSEELLQVVNIFSNQVANIMHRNRLFGFLIRQNSVMEGVQNAALHILKYQDEKTRLEHIVEEARKLLDAKGGKVYLTENGSRQDLRLVAHTGIPPQYIQREVISKWEGMAGQVVLTRQPIINNDYASYPHRIPEVADFFSAVIEVPLMIGDEVIGVLGVFDDQEKHSFTHADQVVLERLASQTALAIYNNRLYNELDALYQTSLQIAQQADMKDLAKRILSELRRIIQYDRAVIQVFESLTLPRKILTWEGFEEEPTNEKLLRPVAEDTLMLSIVQSQRVFILSDPYTFPEWDKDIAESQKVRSWACLPLMYKGEILGVIVLEHFIPGYYQEKDISRLERFSAFAATALYNSSIGQLHLSELQKFAKRITRITPEDTKETLFIETITHIQSTFSPCHFTFHYINDQYLIFSQITVPDLTVTSLLPGEGLAGWVAQEGETKLYPDDFAALITGAITKSGVTKIFAPFWENGSVVAGVLEIEMCETELDQARKSFIATLCTQASLAIQQVEQRERKVLAIKTRFNPYTAGAPIRRPEDFYGRENLMADLLSGIYKNNYALIDERRIGKTSILFRLELETKYNTKDNEVMFFPVYFSLEGISSEDYYTLLINKIYQALNLNFEITEHPKAYGFHLFRRDLDRIKRENSSIWEGKQPIILLLMDEVDKLNHYPPAIQEQLRAILVGEQMLRVVMAGYVINFHEHSPTSPWYNFLKIKKVGDLSEEDARQLIIKPIAGTYTYSTDAIKRILEYGRYKPFFIQEICHDAVGKMLSRMSTQTENNKKSMILIDDVESAIDDLTK